jgi:diguanylate cyclase (GGDEF)-like protein
MNNCIRQYDGSFFCLMMIDIDRFKDFNDTYGHLVGDEILKQTAKILLREKGPNATVARWGGEEFIMFGVADNKTDAENKAENLRKTIENSHFDAGETLRGCSLHVTVSIGVACNKCDRGIKYGNILKIADDAMYYSKSRGKNTVTVREF